MSYEFEDLSKYTLPEKEDIIMGRYKKDLLFAGKQHAVIKRIISLNNNSKPNPEKLAVIEGIWALSMAMQYDIKIKYLVICIEDIIAIEAQKLIDQYVEKAEKCFVVSKKVFETITEKGNSHGLLAVCYLPMSSFENIRLRDKNIVLILDGLEIPGNIGTILRSADATNVDAVIINNRKTRLNHPKLIRSSMGSCFSVPVIESNAEETIEWLKQNNFEIILTDTRAESQYYELPYKNRVAIVMGSEKYGVSEDWYSTPYVGVSIPMLGNCDSLNVGIAATIILYEATLKNSGKLNRDL